MSSSLRRVPDRGALTLPWATPFSIRVSQVPLQFALALACRDASSACMSAWYDERTMAPTAACWKPIS